MSCTTGSLPGAGEPSAGTPGVMAMYAARGASRLVIEELDVCLVSV